VTAFSGRRRPRRWLPELRWSLVLPSSRVNQSKLAEEEGTTLLENVYNSLD